MMPQRPVMMPQPKLPPPPQAQQAQWLANQRGQRTPEQVRTDRISQLVAKRDAHQRGVGYPLTPSEEQELRDLSIPPGQKGPAAPMLPGPVPQSSRPMDDDPYGMVEMWDPTTGRTKIPRYEAEAKRYEAEAKRRASDLNYEKSQMELEQMRWMFEQMRSNPYGMNIRDLIYGKGGK